MNYYLSAQQMKRFYTLIESEANRVPPQPPGNKFNNQAHVNQELILEFKDGKPKLVKYLNHALGPFTELKTSPDDYPIPIEDKAKWSKILKHHPNVKIIFNQGSDGAVYWTKIKAIYQKEVTLTENYE
jgi:hypothetical protein